MAGSDGFIYSTISSRGPRPRPLRLAVKRDKDGYYKTEITRDGVKKTIRVHNAVAKAFKGLPRAGQECRHRDGSKRNNLPSNLCWGTRLDNARDRDRHQRTAKGERSGSAVLSNSQAVEIKLRLRFGELQKNLAVEFGVCKATISHIKTGRNWKWLQQVHQ